MQQQLFMPPVCLQIKQVRLRRSSGQLAQHPPNAGYKQPYSDCVFCSSRCVRHDPFDSRPSASVYLLGLRGRSFLCKSHHSRTTTHTPIPGLKRNLFCLVVAENFLSFFSNCVCASVCVCVYFLDFGDFKQTSFVSTPPACVSSACQFRLL